MSEVIKKRQVAKEILELLKDHSPLTLVMMQKMIEPPLKKKNIRQALGILKRKGYIDMVVGNSQSFFYQINQSLKGRQLVSDELNSSKLINSKPLLRRQEWFHNEWCEFWILIISRAFPEAEIVREHEIENHTLAKNVLLQNDKCVDLLPDFLVLFPKTATTEKISIAFEIERTRKSDKRIQKKLKKYIFETHIDGLIYVCDNGRMAETIRQLYEKKVVEKAHKKRGYVNNFFLFSDAMSASDSPLLSFYNANAKPTSLVDWCKQLRSTKLTSRRDAQFLNA